MFMTTALKLGTVLGRPVEVEADVKDGVVVWLVNILNPKERDATTWEGEGFDPLHDETGISLDGFLKEVRKDKFLSRLCSLGVVSVVSEEPCLLQDEYGQKVIRPRFKFVIDRSKLNILLKSDFVLKQSGGFLVLHGKRGS
jgi:hypothetical protein